MDLATSTPTLSDRAWQSAYRLAFPLAKAWWRLRGESHIGALVAVHVDGKLLLLESSYRSEWHFPGGGVGRDETPADAAKRELREEIGLDATLLGSATIVRGRWDGRSDEVHVFKLELCRLPNLKLDNREIVGARLVTTTELTNLRFTGPVQAYLRLRSGQACNGGPD